MSILKINLVIQEKKQSEESVFYAKGNKYLYILLKVPTLDERRVPREQNSDTLRMYKTSWETYSHWASDHFGR